jgi:hypothetical protein
LHDYPTAKTCDHVTVDEILVLACVRVVGIRVPRSAQDVKIEKQESQDIWVIGTSRNILHIPLVREIANDAHGIGMDPKGKG